MPGPFLTEVPEIKTRGTDKPAVLPVIEEVSPDGSVEQYLHFQNLSLDLQSDIQCLEAASRAAMFKVFAGMDVRFGPAVDKKASSFETGIKEVEGQTGVYGPRTRFTEFCIMHMSFFMKGEQSVTRWFENRIKTEEDKVNLAEALNQAYLDMPRPHFQPPLPGF